MTTKTIGEILKEERESHRLKLEALAQRTRIRLEHLKSLEKNDFKNLPAATFVKGYIKSYAQVFGFDYQPLLALLRRDYQESAKGRLVPREFIKPMLNKSAFWTPTTSFLVVLSGIFLSLFGYVAMQWYQLNKPPELVITSPEDNQVVSAQVSLSGQTDQDASVTVNSQPVSLQRDGSFETSLTLPREGISTITIEAQDEQGRTTMVQRSVRVEF